MAGETQAAAGVVYLVGAGPGDPGLFTLRGLDCLRTADVVVYDTLVNPRLLDHAPAEALRIAVGRRQGQRGMPQGSVNDLLIDHARAGRTVVRLKGGDPFVFGRGGEELEAVVAAGLRCEVVPGVTAGIAVPAYAGIAVTHRDRASAVAFVTGHEDPTKPDSPLDWAALAAFPGTLVFYMGVKQLSELSVRLIQNGKLPETPTAVIQWGTTARQRIVQGILSDIVPRVTEASLSPPAVIVVGSVARTASERSWFENRPLFGQRIVLTRPHHQAGSNVRQLEELGAEVLELPGLRLQALSDYSRLDRAIAEFEQYDWVVFTSANGVLAWLNRMAAVGRDSRIFGGSRVAAIGNATADELYRAGRVHADLIAADASSESLVAALRQVGAVRRVLLVRAEQGREVVAEGLRAAEIAFDQVIAYRMVDETNWSESVLRRLENGEADWITMTSPRIVRALSRGLPDSAKAHIGAKIKIASISALTSSAAHEMGWTPAVEAKHANMESLIEVMRGYTGCTHATSRHVS